MNQMAQLTQGHESVGISWDLLTHADSSQLKLQRGQRGLRLRVPRRLELVSKGCRPPGRGEHPSTDVMSE